MLPIPRADAIALRNLVAALLAKDPGALASVLRRPTISALLRTIRHELTPTGNRARVGVLLTELFATLAIDLAATGALPDTVRASRLPEQLLSLQAKLAIRSTAGTSAVFDNGKVVLEITTGKIRVNLNAEQPAEGVVSRPYHALQGNVLLALADNNPLAMLEAHPDKQGNAIDLGSKSLSEWRAMLNDGLALIAAHLPALHSEFELFIQQIVPVGYDAEKHLSASYQEAIGTIYMTLHPSLMTMTEALIHEFSHNKINALFELDDILENAFSPLYASPVRPDPRPLHGVLLAVHAFQPVARLYEAMIQADHPLAKSAAFKDRYARIRGINREGAEVVLSRMGSRRRSGLRSSRRSESGIRISRRPGSPDPPGVYRLSLATR